jgi:hypothetical protein
MSSSGGFEEGFDADDDLIAFHDVIRRDVGNIDMGPLNNSKRSTKHEKKKRQGVVLPTGAVFLLFCHIFLS